jgi:hypothetical protein
MDWNIPLVPNKEMLRSGLEQLRVIWELGKRRRDDVSELEKLKDSFRHDHNLVRNSDLFRLSEADFEESFIHFH